MLKLDVIGVPMDLGADRRGVDMGPSAIRNAGLNKAIQALDIAIRDLGNINVTVAEKAGPPKNSNLKYLGEINKSNAELAKVVERSVHEGHIPLVLGGDHSIAVGTILGVQSVLKKIGVIWMDAHADFNSADSSPSGNLHGMPLAACTGFGDDEITKFKRSEVSYIDPDKVALIGVRDIDPLEARRLKQSGIHVFTMSDIDMLGMKRIMKKALAIVTDGTAGFHLSFDMDVICPADAPGVGTPVSGGLTYREAHLAAEMIADTKKLRSLEFVEVNPILDKRNATGELAVELILSSLGKKIL